MKIPLRSLYALLVVCTSLAVPTLVNAQSVVVPSNSMFESALVRSANADRVAGGFSPLTKNTLLASAAQKKADDMAKESYFAHYSPEGVSPWYWFTLVGYYYTHAGENLAMNFNSPASTEAAWMSSPLHRGNILRGVYTQIGIGISHGMYLGKPTTFIVELFATPTNKTNPA